MPVGPGADLFEAVTRFLVTSSSVIGIKPHEGRGGGSSGSESGIGFGTVGKKCSDRTWRRLVCDTAREPSGFRRGGILLAQRPWCHAVAFHKVSMEAPMRRSLDQPHLALVIMWWSACIAPLRDSPQMEATAVRAASQCMFHHLRPQKSGVWRHLNSLPETM